MGECQYSVPDILNDCVETSLRARGSDARNWGVSGVGLGRALLCLASNPLSHADLAGGETLMNTSYSPLHAALPATTLGASLSMVGGKRSIAAGTQALSRGQQPFAAHAGQRFQIQKVDCQFAAGLVWVDALDQPPNVTSLSGSCRSLGPHRRPFRESIGYETERFPWLQSLKASGTSTMSARIRAKWWTAT